MGHAVRLLVLGAFVTGLAGCGQKPPPLHPVTGKITYGGKAYPRLMVHFRPASGPVTEYNLAVGETDKEGKLGIMSVHGGGLQAGEYKVTFGLYQDVRSGKAVGGSEKPDEAGVTAKQVIAPPYDDESSQGKTPVTFKVQPGENNFTFDIPKP